MKIGTVTGAVWSTRKAACLSGQTFLVVRTAAPQRGQYLSSSIRAAPQFGQLFIESRPFRENIWSAPGSPGYKGLLPVAQI